MENSQSIYVVTIGQYSDRHVVAATTSKERAEKIKARYDRHDDYSTSEILRFEDGEEKAHPMWRVAFWSDGSVKDVQDVNPDYYSEDVSVDDYAQAIVYLHAEDVYAAIKGAAERRAKKLAEKSGL